MKNKVLVILKADYVIPRSGLIVTIVYRSVRNDIITLHSYQNWWTSYVGTMGYIKQLILQ